jgi:hypothetical protein
MAHVGWVIGSAPGTPAAWETDHRFHLGAAIALAEGLVLGAEQAAPGDAADGEHVRRLAQERAAALRDALRAPKHATRPLDEREDVSDADQAAAEGLHFQINGVFLSEGAFISPVNRSRVPFPETIVVTEGREFLKRTQQTLMGSFSLSTERLLYSHADSAEYSGWVVIQGYPTIWVRGTVYRDTNTGAFYRWP